VTAPRKRARSAKASGKPAAKRTPTSGSDADRIVVRLTEAAMSDLESMARKGDPQVVRWALKKCLHLERNPRAGEELRGPLIGYRKLVVGDRGWRVVWRVGRDESQHLVVDVAEVWAVGARSDDEVYTEMTERVAAMAGRPSTVALAEAIERLGKLAVGLVAASEPPAEAAATPGWLVHVLTRVVQMPPQEVNRLTPQQAQQVWEAWTSGSH
jgi:mRNA interferase RelE/StbE